MDHDLMPIRGRLIHLKPNPELDYLLLCAGYMFPRTDRIVLGGTFDVGEDDLSFDLAAYEDILRRHRHFFGEAGNGPVIRWRDIPYNPVPS